MQRAREKQEEGETGETGGTGRVEISLGRIGETASAVEEEAGVEVGTSTTETTIIIKVKSRQRWNRSPS